MEEEVDIVVTGFNVDAKQAEAGLMRLFGIDGADARRFLQGLPTIAKRRAQGPTAARYIEALESIGARVDAVPARRGDPTGRTLSQAPPSLPAPPSSMMQELHRSMRVDRATEEAIERFRESEGMEARPSSSEHPSPAPDRYVSFGPDPMNPRIPQAPRLPSLDGMPNAQISDEGPAWRTGTSTDPRKVGGGFKSFPSSDPFDEERPTTSIEAPWKDGVPLPDQPKAAGTSKHSEVNPGPSTATLRAMQRVAAAEQERRRRRVQLIVGLVIALVAAWSAAEWWASRDTDAEARRLAAIEREGIAPGALAPARSWLDNPSNAVRRLSAADADALLTAFERAGAVSVEVMRVDGPEAAGLLIELPESSEQRTTLLWQVARSQGREPSLDDDRGQRFVELLF